MSRMPPVADTPSAPVGLRERKRTAARARAADVALALIAERGYEAVTVADICEAAEIAPRSFFRYFAGKEEVLVEPVRRLNDELAAFIAAAPPALDDGAALRSALRALGEHVLAHHDRLSAFFDVIAVTAPVRSSPLLALGDRERDVAVLLQRRHGRTEPPDWRTRLLVARTLAGFRIWMEQLRSGEVDPGQAATARLDEILAAT
jgi:AcrR family transcriptional regulator